MIAQCQLGELHRRQTHNLERHDNGLIADVGSVRTTSDSLTACFEDLSANCKNGLTIVKEWEILI
jgi:hypothetical protein